MFEKLLKVSVSPISVNPPAGRATVKMEGHTCMQWQDLKSNHGIMRRAKVPGGWFVIYQGESIAMVFYPDPEHKWDGHSEFA